MLVSVFLGLGLIGWFAALAGLELYCARRSARSERSSDERLLTNFAFGAVTFAVGVLVPVSRVEASAAAHVFGLGLAPRLGLSWVGALVLFLLVDSLAIYWVHRLMHRTPLLWRVHRVHHSDQGFDISTSLRNHPFEMILAVPTLVAVVLMVGAPASVVVAAQTIGLTVTIFQHADIDLPPNVAQAFAWLVVTPDIHRVHHNPVRAVHDSNYGELLTVWDRLFGTLRRPAGRGPVGLEDQVAEPDRLIQQIWSPIHGT